MKKKISALLLGSSLLFGGVDAAIPGAVVEPLPGEIARTSRTTIQDLGDGRFVSTSLLAPVWEQRYGEWREIRVPIVARALGGLVNIAHAADTGFKTAGAVVSAGNWTSFTTTNLNTSNDVRAICSNASNCDAGGGTEDGTTNNYSFGITSGATIDGIEVTIEGRCNVTACGSAGDKFEAALSWNNNSNWTAVKQTGSVGTSESTFTLGGAADKWGRTWTDTEFADGTFQLGLGAECDAGIGCNNINHKMEVDFVQVKVYYTVAAPADAKVPDIPPLF